MLRAAVEAVRAAPHGDEAHLDVETYTWAVLPPDSPAFGSASPAAGEPLVAGIAAELRWATDHLLTPGAAPCPVATVNVPAPSGVPA